MRPIIAATRSEEDFALALKSKADTIFDLSPTIFTLKERTQSAHQNNKKLFIHMDLIEGLGKDKSALCYVKKIGVDGIISTKTNLIRLAHQEGLHTVQRYFIVDSQFVASTAESIRSSKADMIEVMPGVLPKVIERLKGQVDVKIIAGGLIETKEEVRRALLSGAVAISTGERTLWEE